jgi:hypothetical protein
MHSIILIGGVGSFLAPMIALSKKLNKLFISGYDDRLIQVAKSSKIKTSLGYFNNYIKPGEWQNSQQQRDLMIKLDKKNVFLEDLNY